LTKSGAETGAAGAAGTELTTGAGEVPGTRPLYEQASKVAVRTIAITAKENFLFIVISPFLLLPA
jgi:hypothetical protein